MKKIILFLLLTTSIVFSQDIPRYIAYQGVLIDKNKQLKPDGDYSIKFELYDDEFTGSLIWNKTFNPIKVINGVFGELLGPFDNTVKFDKQYFVQVTVGNEQLNKRVPLTSSAYALGIANNSVSNSKIQDNAVTGTKIIDNAITSSKIADNAISSSKIQDVEVIETKLALNSISNRTIIADAIDSFKIKDKSISYNDLSISSASTGNVLTYNNNTWQPQAPSGVPVGTVMAFIGDGTKLSSLESQGWYLCDGRLINSLSLSATEQINLILILQSGAWTSTTSLPDFRGYFLRGANAGTLLDPLGSRRDSISNRLPGSYQQDAFQGHWHRLYPMSSSYSNGVSPFSNLTNTGPIDGTSGQSLTHIQNSITDGTNGTPRTTYETRPKNISVNWIIKAK